MLLQIHSDAAYMNETKARSTAGGHYFLGKPILPNQPIFLNSAIHSLCKVIEVAASAAEAELGSLFLNTQEAVKLRIALDGVGHKQPPTPINIDNSTTFSIIHKTIKQQCSRAMNMRYFWTISKQDDGTVDISWHPRRENLGDYVTKHPPPKIHQNLRSTYLHMKNCSRYLQRNLPPYLLRVCAKPYPFSDMRTRVSPYISMITPYVRRTNQAE